MINDPQQPINHNSAQYEIEEDENLGSAPVANYKQDEFLSGLPAKQGLYDPELEKDACGVGMCLLKEPD